MMFQVAGVSAQRAPRMSQRHSKEFNITTVHAILLLFTVLSPVKRRYCLVSEE